MPDSANDNGFHGNCLAQVIGTVVGGLILSGLMVLWNRSGDNVPSNPPPGAGNTPVGQSGEELRTWTDETGQFQVEAVFVSLTLDKLKLRKRDGEEVVLSKKQLSGVDREWLTERGMRAKK